MREVALGGRRDVNLLKESSKEEEEGPRGAEGCPADRRLNTPAFFSVLDAEDALGAVVVGGVLRMKDGGR